MITITIIIIIIIIIIVIICLGDRILRESSVPGNAQRPQKEHCKPAACILGLIRANMRLSLLIWSSDYLRGAASSCARRFRLQAFPEDSFQASGFRLSGFWKHLASGFSGRPPGAWGTLDPSQEHLFTSAQVTNYLCMGTLEPCHLAKRGATCR